MTTGDIFNTGLLMVTSFGVLATFRQIYLSNKQKRADLILQLYNQFNSDNDMIEAYFALEYETFKYDESFHDSEFERKLDKLLGLFSNIGLLFQMGIIRKSDLDFIKYEFQIIYENQEVNRYFEFLDNWFLTRKITHKKFEPFRTVGKQIVVDNYKKVGIQKAFEIEK